MLQSFQIEYESSLYIILFIGIMILNDFRVKVSILDFVIYHIYRMFLQETVAMKIFIVSCLLIVILALDKFYTFCK
jgi:hypothetical protein